MVGTPTTAQNYVYNGAKPEYSQNLIYDEYGQIRMFIIDGNVYNSDGILLAGSVYNNLALFDGIKINLPEGITETTIVPVPNKCNSYFVIAASYADQIGFSSNLQLRSTGVTATLHYYEVDFNRNHDYYSNIMGAVEYKGELNVYYSDCGSIHLAATREFEIPNPNPNLDPTKIRYLYVSDCSAIYKCDIKETGITVPFASNFIPNGMNGISHNRNEMEVVKKGDKFIVAREIEFDQNYIPSNTSHNFVDFVEIREFNALDGEGDFPSTDGRRIFYLSFSVPGTDSYNITGIEITPSGNMVYVSTKEAPYLWFADITTLIAPIASNTGTPQIHFYLLNPVSSVAPFTVDASYEGSQVEYAKDNKIYMYSGNDNFITIDDWDNINNPIVVNTNSLNLNNPASNGYNQPISGFYTCHLLNDQIDGDDYKGFYAETPECCSDGIVYNIESETKISTNTVWNTSNTPWGTGIGYVEDDLIIETGAKLTLNGITLHFSRNAKLIIEPGASLVASNSILTSVQCEGIMWPGIEVWGTQGVAHSTQFNSAYGSVILQNTEVSNAINGITTAPRLLNGTSYDLTKSGGYIKATSSDFINNSIDVDMTPHLFTGLPTLFPPQLSKSYFKSCNFKTTMTELKDESYPDVHVKLTQVRGVNFYGNVFKNESNDFTSFILFRGTGIRAIDSKFNVTYSCANPVLIGTPCPEQDRVGNVFENLNYGINASAVNTMNNVVVEHCDFINTQRGIRLVGMVGAVMDENHFEVGADHIGSGIQSHGIHMTNCSKYFCQNNDFSTNFNGEYGIVTVNSGNKNNEIRNNIFTGLKYGATASKINFGTNTTTGVEFGLQYLCNEFYTSDYVDVQVPSGGVHNAQGACDQFNTQININLQPANNTFSFPEPTAKHFSIDNSTVSHPTFYIHSANNLSAFDIVPNNVSTLVFNNTPCGPSNFPIIKSDVCPEREYKIISTGGLFSRISLSQGEIESLFQLIDNNDKQGLLNVIANQSAGQVKNTLMEFSPYLSDEVLIAYIGTNPPAGHLKQVIIANSPVSDAVMAKLNNINIPNGIRNQINAAQIGISGMQELKDQISAVTFSKDGYSDELFRRYLNDTLNNKMDSLEYLLTFDPNEESEYLRVSVKLLKADYLGAQTVINSIRNSGNANENSLKLLESLITIYNCQDKAYRLNWDLPLKSEIENIAAADPDKRECRNAGALLELLKILDQPELYEVINLNNVRSMFEESTDVVNNQKFTIYPNPGTDFINIQTSETNESMIITIFDLSGKAIYSAQKSSVDYMMVDVTDFAKGMYLVQVSTEKEILETQKLVIE